MVITEEREPDVVPTLFVHMSGPVTSADREYAERAVGHALVLAPMAIWTAKIDLRIEPDWPRPALVRLIVGHDGHVVHAHADAFSIPEAIDVAGLRLRRRLDDLARLEGLRISGQDRRPVISTGRTAFAVADHPIASEPVVTANQTKAQRQRRNDAGSSR